MKRLLIIYATVIVCLVATFALIGRTGMVDMKQKVEIIPPGAMPHGGAEKPIGTTGIGPGETKR